ncbi:MAG: hypothetical protein KatS3mg119_2025 [Rhodothalassiaceae bacterium]|nr:MAG: hypothetical protein KatS3mg119_2025 [Rhodothalassiaceae bacterium]
MSRRAHLWLAWLHRILGLVIGIQLLLWTMGGIVMSWLPLEEVRGDHRRAPHPALALTEDEAARPLVLPAGVREAEGLQLIQRDGRLVWAAPRAGAHAAVFDARTGAPLPPLQEEAVRRLAQQQYRGNSTISSLALLANPEALPQEYRGPLPVWQAVFADGEGTRFYLSPTTGRLLDVRNDIWRFYDFFWMLHIMDYATRENFNNPLLRAAAPTAFLMALAGWLLLFWRLRRKDLTGPPRLRG